MYLDRNKASKAGVFKVAITEVVTDRFFRYVTHIRVKWFIKKKRKK